MSSAAAAGGNPSARCRRFASAGISSPGVTETATSAANAVDTVTNAPLKLLNMASEKVHDMVSGKKASDESVALASAAEEEKTPALEEPVKEPANAQELEPSVAAPAAQPEEPTKVVAASSMEQPAASASANRYFTYGG